jgi:hypothetical protein
MHACVCACLPACLPAFLPAFLPACLPATSEVFGVGEIRPFYQVERDLRDISDIVRDVAGMVQTQGEQLGEGSRGIESNLTHARAAAHCAAVETAKAGKSRAKRRVFEGGTTAAAVGGVVGKCNSIKCILAHILVDFGSCACATATVTATAIRATSQAIHTK